MVRKTTGGMLGGGGVFNAHNQGVSRGRYQGEGSSGFFIEFVGSKDLANFEAALEDGAIKIEETAIEAAIATGDEMKQRLRTLLDGVFQHSAPTANNHRRATNAMVQSAVYSTVKGKPGFTYLLYSKLGRGKGPASFVDYLLAHLHGQTITAPNWFRIAVSPDAKALQRSGGRFTTGSFRGAKSKVFLTQAKGDPDKLFLLRRDNRAGKTTLLEVLLKSIRIEPKLGGMEEIFSQAEAIFDRHADAGLVKAQRRLANQLRGSIMSSVRAQIFAAVEQKLEAVRGELGWNCVLVNPRGAVGEDQMNALLLACGGDAEPGSLTGSVETHVAEFSVGLVVMETANARAEELLDTGYVAVSDALLDPTDIQLGGLVVQLRRGSMSQPFIGRGANGARIVGVQSIDFDAEYWAQEGDASSPGP